MKLAKQQWAEIGANFPLCGTAAAIRIQDLSRGAMTGRQCEGTSR